MHADVTKLRRQQMVDRQLRERGITNHRVIQAFLEVPREKFISTTLKRLAYSDRPLPIGFNQTISQPFIVAYMCELLELTGKETVLDVGTGSGYQAAILSRLAKRVISIEIINALAKRANIRLQQLGYTNVIVVTGDGNRGSPAYAPFDAIVAAAAGSIIPPAWKDQLAEPGTIVMPLKHGKSEQLVTVTHQHGTFTVEEHYPVSFVPLVNKKTH